MKGSTISELKEVMLFFSILDLHIFERFCSLLRQSLCFFRMFRKVGHNITRHGTESLPKLAQIHNRISSIHFIVKSLNPSQPLRMIRIFRDVAICSSVAFMPAEASTYISTEQSYLQSSILDDQPGQHHYHHQLPARNGGNTQSPVAVRPSKSPR